MRNVWTICRRELYSYFVSPIAWVLLTLFAFLSGWFAWLSSSYFVQDTMASQMRGQAAPMSVNEMVIAPLFGNIAVIGPKPMDTVGNCQKSGISHGCG